MKEFYKITLTNSIIFFIYLIAANSIDDSGHHYSGLGKFLIMIMCLIGQILFNFFIALYYFSNEKPNKGKIHILNCLLVFFIGLIYIFLQKNFNTHTHQLIQYFQGFLKNLVSFEIQKNSDFLIPNYFLYLKSNNLLHFHQEFLFHFVIP